MSETKLTELQLQQLKNNLPKGYDKKIRERLIKKGKEYTAPSIRRGLMFKYQSEAIIKEAYELALEHKEEQERLKKDIESLDNDL